MLHHKDRNDLSTDFSPRFKVKKQAFKRYCVFYIDQGIYLIQRKFKYKFFVYFNKKTILILHWGI